MLQVCSRSALPCSAICRNTQRYHQYEDAETSVFNRDTLLMLYCAIVRSKFDYGCIVYGTASNTKLRQLDSMHNSGLRLALGAFCTSPVSSLYTEANGAPLEERRLKLSMHYYVKTRACIDNPAHHALHEFDRTIRHLYAPRPNGRPTGKCPLYR